MGVFGPFDSLPLGAFRVCRCKLYVDPFFLRGRGGDMLPTDWLVEIRDGSGVAGSTGVVGTGVVAVGGVDVDEKSTNSDLLRTLLRGVLEAVGVSFGASVGESKSLPSLLSLLEVSNDDSFPRLMKSQIMIVPSVPVLIKLISPLGLSSNSATSLTPSV